MLDEESKKKIREHYIRGQGSIQDIARVYRVEVDEVLNIIGLNDLSSVDAQGDLIDASEAGPGAEINHGKTFQVPYSTN